MKRKNLALRMSAYMMSALLVVGSAAPTYAAEEVTFADEATDIAVEDTGEGETEVTEDEFADLDLEGDGSEEIGDSADLFTDEAGETTGDQTGIDTAALEATIAKADALDEMTYTKASWDGNKDAIVTAKAAAKAVKSSDYTAAVQAINDATAGLVKVKAQTITISVKNSKDTVSKKFGDKAFSLGAKAKGGVTYKSSNIKIAAAAKGNYNAGSKTVTVTVKVK